MDPAPMNPDRHSCCKGICWLRRERGRGEDPRHQMGDAAFLHFMFIFPVSMPTHMILVVVQDSVTGITGPLPVFLSLRKNIVLDVVVETALSPLGRLDHQA